MIPVTFYNSTQLIDLDTLNRLHEDGVIDRVRLDGRDFFVSADVAMDLRNDGIIEMDKEYHYDGFVKKAGIKKGGGKCGRGWVGIKGSCKRMAKGSDRDGAQKVALKEFAAGQRSKRTPASMAKKAQAPPMARESTKTKSKAKRRSKEKERVPPRLDNWQEKKLNAMGDRSRARILEKYGSDFFSKDKDEALLKPA